MASARWVRRHLSLAIVLAAVLVVRVLVTESFAVEGSSMAPSFSTGDRVIVEKLAAPGRGDVVILHADGTTLIKRVIALEGDVIEVRGCRAYVNGVPVDGSEIDSTHAPGAPACTYPASRIPAGTVFVLGDNRDDSIDSRSFGPVSSNDVVGRALILVWPFTRIRPLG